MSDFYFYSESVQDATVTVDGTPDTGFPVTNIQDLRKSTIYSDTSAGGDEIYLKMDFGSGNTLQPDYFALVNFTFACNGTEDVHSHFYKTFFYIQNN